MPTKATLFFFGCLEVNSTWLITSELANQRARKVLFTCVVYTNNNYTNHHQHHHNHNDDLITVLSVFPLKGGSSSVKFTLRVSHT